MESFMRDCRQLGIPVTDTGLDDYLSDEARFRGHASAVVRARSETDVVELVRLSYRHDITITVVSAKTSLTGAAAPAGGVIPDIKALDRIDPRDCTRVGPGVVLKHYKALVAGLGFFFPPDPGSEDSCTLGGNVACNASGPLSYLYGPTRDHINGLRVVLPSGGVLEVSRGQVVGSGVQFVVPRRFIDPPPDQDLVVPLPRTGAPQWSRCKSAAGLFSSDAMDLVDLFIGSEGILGIITEIRTRLLPGRRPFFALMLYLPDFEMAVNLVTFLNELKQFFHDKNSHRETGMKSPMKKFFGSEDLLAFNPLSSIAPSCMEWFGSSVARFLSPERAGRLRACYGCLYIEQEYDPGEDPLDVAALWWKMLDRFTGAGWRTRSEIQTEVAVDERHIRQMRKDRQAVPERLNEAILPGMVKVGMDFAVPMESLGPMMKLYDESLGKVDAYVFGHIGNAHLHVNLLPQAGDDLEQCRSLYWALARENCAMSGSVSGEHGIGKLKRDLLELMIGQAGIEEIRRVKRALDPKNLLNRGNMIGPAR